MARIPLLAVLMLLAMAPVLDAQSATGIITGKFVDEDGRPLVGLMVRTGKFGGLTNVGGNVVIANVPAGSHQVECAGIGLQTQTLSVQVRAGDTTDLGIITMETESGSEVLVVGTRPNPERVETTRVVQRQPLAMTVTVNGSSLRAVRVAEDSPGTGQVDDGQPVADDDNDASGEGYNRIYENPFLEATTQPVSTFSIDVDAASYANIRRFVNQGSLPPANAVRIEEMINYFEYDYPEPRGEHPFSITTESAECPWSREHRLLQVGLQGQRIGMDDLPPNNLVFLLDVSGSMNVYNKLSLLKSAFRLLAEQMREQDRLAIVVYAGAAGVVLPSTPGSEKGTVLVALEHLQAGGSTAGGEGIELAYSVARQNYIPGGNNRVILATDGDFNVGTSSQQELVALIEEKRDHGVFLSVFGFGTGNLQDARMEQLADNGSGHYAYIDELAEARKVLVEELGATLFTIAKDVKLQVVFDPERVKSYRLIGYENRLLGREDFDDDRKDAGDLGAGHSVTAIYEIEPAGPIPGYWNSKSDTLDMPHYFDAQPVADVRLRYKRPDDTVSVLLEHRVEDRGLNVERTSDNFRFAAAVAAAGMLLRKSQHAGNATWEQVLQLATAASGADPHGYRREFIALVRAVRQIQ